MATSAEPALPPALQRGEPGFRPIAIGLFFAGFTTFALLYATQPLLPALVDDYGIAPATASLAVSVSTAAVAIGIIPASALSERWGRRPVMIGSLVAAVVLGLAAAVAPDFGLLLVLRGLGGIGSTMFTVSAMALLVRLAPPRLRGRVSSTSTCTGTPCSWAA